MIKKGEIVFAVQEQRTIREAAIEDKEIVARLEKKDLSKMYRLVDGKTIRFYDTPEDLEKGKKRIRERKLAEEKEKKKQKNKKVLYPNMRRIDIKHGELCGNCSFMTKNKSMHLLCTVNFSSTGSPIRVKARNPKCGKYKRFIPQKKGK